MRERGYLGERGRGFGLGEGMGGIEKLISSKETFFVLIFSRKDIGSGFRA